MFYPVNVRSRWCHVSTLLLLDGRPIGDSYKRRSSVWDAWFFFEILLFSLAVCVLRLLFSENRNSFLILCYSLKYVVILSDFYLSWVICSCSHIQLLRECWVLCNIVWLRFECQKSKVLHIGSSSFCQWSFLWWKHLYFGCYCLGAKV